jgi:hypothetical protein
MVTINWAVLGFKRVSWRAKATSRGHQPDG